MADLDLLNQFWKATESEKHLACYKGAVRRARPYTLDADATELVTELSSGETIQSKLLIYRRLARLPFDVMWIEFDYNDRLNMRRALQTVPANEDIENAPLKMGFMIEKVTETQWRALTVASFRDSESGRTCDTFGAVHVVSTEGPVDFRTHARDPAVREVVKKANAEKYGLLGWGFGVRDSDGTDHNTYLPELDGTTAVDVAPSVERIITTIRDNQKARYDIAKEQLFIACGELKGDLRFICAALALLNEVPLTVRSIQREGSTRVGGSIKPFMVNRIVSVAIPKTKGRVRKIGAMLRLAERSMRRHEVAGHWKTVVLKGGERERRWIKNYERGDASLGYVHQIREVSRS